MNVDEIIEALSLDEEAYRKAANEQVAQSGYKDGWLKRASILHDAIEKLKTHPDNQPNEPLTLEELLEMAGQPIWTVTHGCGPGRWELFLGVETIGTPAHEVLRLAVPPGEIDDISIETYRVTWAAYRRPPEEETT